jgi:beta-galactosidase
MKYFGASYYPESWGIERLAIDIELMKDAGINMVRLGEFAWSRMEKRQGEYDFEIFRKSVDMFAEAGIDVMMCTPTAAPPAWLTHDYPQTLVVDSKSHSAFHGIRQQGCYNSDIFREFSCKITDRLSQSLADCENIPVWQIDNELGQRLFGFCHCEKCQQDFRAWLEARYQTLDKLNFCWKNEFWSQDYSDWEQIKLAFLDENHAVSRVLDSLRFYDETIRNYMLEQAGVIRKNIPQAKITTNNPVGILDLNAMYENLDYAAGDFYWNNRKTSNMALRLSTYRSYKNNKFYIAEAGLYGDIYNHSKDKYARLDMWRSIAHGALSYLIFRWRPPLGGQEQTALGLVSPSGKPRTNHKVCKALFTEAKKLCEALADIQLPDAMAAVMIDSDVDKTYMRHGWGSSIKYNSLINDVFEQMHMRNINTDIVSPRCPLDKYKILILPSQRITHKDTALRIKKFIRDGGVVWALAECHTADENANFTLMDAPNYLVEEFGINIETGAVLPAGNDVAGTLGSGNVGKGWCADIDLYPSAESLLEFVDGYYGGQTAVSCNQCEGGYVIYQGMSNPGPELLHKISEYVIDKAKISYPDNCPEGVEIINCGNTVFIINSTESAVSFKYSANGDALIGTFDNRTGIVELDALDICIIKFNNQVF